MQIIPFQSLWSHLSIYVRKSKQPMCNLVIPCTRFCLSIIGIPEFTRRSVSLFPLFCVQDDESLMRSLFQQLLDDETDDAARRNLIKFLKEFCNFSTSLQPSERDHFFQVREYWLQLNCLHVCPMSHIIMHIASSYHGTQKYL